METPCGKPNNTYSVTNARARPSSTGYIKEAIIDRRRLCSNAWTMRASLSVILCAFIRIARRLILNVFSTGDTLPADTDHVQWVARHIPLSVSVASNVPGYEDAQCYVTDGDSDKWLGAMMSGLVATSDAAFASLLPSYEDVLDELNARKHTWEEETKEEEEAEEGRNNPYKTLIGQLLGWLRQLPVIGFNSGQYNLNVVKKFFIPHLLKPSKQDNNDADDEAADEIRLVIKRQNTFMCFATKKLKFLDICNYLAPGFSYAKYLTAYGCAQQKGHFPYEYMDDLRNALCLHMRPSSVVSRTREYRTTITHDVKRCGARTK